MHAPPSRHPNSRLLRLYTLLKGDSVLFSATVCSGLCLVGATGLLLLHHWVFPHVFEPFASWVRVLSGGRAINAVGIKHLNKASVAAEQLTILLITFILLPYWALMYALRQYLPLQSSKPIKSSHPIQGKVWLLPILILALLVRLRWMGRGLGNDEIYASMHFIDGKTLWGTVSTYMMFNNHIAYSLAARFSQEILGRHEWVLRLPSLLLGLSTVALSFYAAQRYLPLIGAAMTAICLAISPTGVLYDCSARGYAGMMFFVLVSSDHFLKLVRKPSRRLLVGYILATSAAIYFHLYASLVVIVQFVLLLGAALWQIFVGGNRASMGWQVVRPLFLAFPIITGVAVFCYSPVLVQLVENIFSSGKGTFNLTFPLTVFTMLSGGVPHLIAVMMLALVFFGLRSLSRIDPLAAIYIGLLFLGPLLTIWLLRPFFLFPRFFVFLLPYFLMLLNIGLHEFCRVSSLPRFMPKGGNYLATAAIVVSLIFAWAPKCWHVGRDGFREAAELLESGSAKNVLFCALGEDCTNFQYYSRQSLYIPSSVAEWEENVRRFSEVRCAYYPVVGYQPAAHTAIAGFLEANSEVHRIENIVVFVWRRSSDVP